VDPVLLRISDILPLPAAVNPVTVPAVQEAVQEKVEVATCDVRITFALTPEQIVFDSGVLDTSGFGFTVMV
jgi:hypothetical protein